MPVIIGIKHTIHQYSVFISSCMSGIIIVVINRKDDTMIDYNTTIKSIEDSIDHWKEIRSRLDNDEIMTSLGGILFWKMDKKMVTCYSMDCPLCSLFRYTDRNMCGKCPIVVVNKNDCDHYYSEWSHFIKNPNKETCNDMITNLEQVLIHYKEKENE